jgi:hypothetical protein
LTDIAFKLNNNDIMSTEKTNSKATTPAKPEPTKKAPTNQPIVKPLRNPLPAQKSNFGRNFAPSPSQFKRASGRKR